MTCCGQGRMILRSNRMAPLAPPVRLHMTPGPVRAAATGAPVRVRYLGAAPIVVRGAVSGRAYRFAASRLIQPVDARDVTGLLGKGLFRRQA